MHHDDPASDTPLDSKLVYRDRLPVSVQAVETATEQSASEQRNNLELLRAFWIFNEKSSEDLKEYPEIQHQLERLELKLDMQASMLAMLLGQSIPLPDPLEISLGAESLTLNLAQPLQAGQAVELQIYLMPEYPKPLRLNASVTASRQQGEGYETNLQLLGLEPAVSELLEKIIFRHHRRQIASMRHKKEH